MVIKILACLALTLVAAPVLSLPHVREVFLAVLGRLTQLIVLAAVTASAVLLCAPELAPPPLLDLVEPAHAVVRPWMPPDAPGLFWLPLGVGIVVLSLPLLAVLDFSQRLTGHTRVVRGLLREIRNAGRELAKEATEAEKNGKPAAGDLRAAVETMHSVAGGEASHGPQRRRLIDFFN